MNGYRGEALIDYKTTDRRCSATGAAAAFVAAILLTLLAAPGESPALPLLEGRAQTITPHGVGRLRLDATVKALHRRRLIGGLRPGCELNPGQRVARLRTPLAGWAVFVNGKRRLTSILITGGAETAQHIGIGSTPKEARDAYPRALYKPPGSFDPFAEGFLWVNNIAHPRLTFIVDPETDLIREVDVPYPNFCE